MIIVVGIRDATGNHLGVFIDEDEIVIKNIEEFKNTYVKNTPELRDAFLSVADKLGIGYRETCGVYESKDCVVAFWQGVDGANFKIGCWYTYADQIKDECRELTLSDLKPRTRTEYEKVEFNYAWQAVKAFEDGEVFHTKFISDGWVVVEQAQQVIPNWQLGKLYRKVEKEIDWHSELGSYLNKPSINGFEEELPTRVCIYLNGIEFHLTDSEYLESCRVALRANGEIE